MQAREAEKGILASAHARTPVSAPWYRGQDECACSEGWQRVPWYIRMLRKLIGGNAGI